MKDIQSIIEIFTNTENVLGYKLNGRKLNVEYSFPDHSFSEIWNIVCSHIGDEKFSTVSMWKYNLLAYRETNEQQHLLGQYGWQQYITDIYVTHHNLAEQGSTKKKLWQDYSISIDQKQRPWSIESGQHHE